MKAQLTLQPVLRPLASAASTVEVRMPTGEAASAFAEAARESGLFVSAAGPVRAGIGAAPAAVAAVVLGALFALIGSQSLNALLGLPRLDSLLSVPAGAAAMLFTVVGVALGSAVGFLISLEDCPTGEHRVLLRGSRRAIHRLARDYKGELR